MKIRGDFVTNSSSTSFVIITSSELTKEGFYKLMGTDKHSLLSDMFASLYDSLKSKMKPIREYHKDWTKNEIDFNTFIEKKFSESIVKRILEAEKKGVTVYMGRLHSDRNDEESFFCCDSFEAENESIFLNASSCTW